MTREEAIKWLIKPAVTSTEVSPTKAKELEAYNMAIEALSAEPTDIISRADAIEAVWCKDCIHQEHCHETVAHTRRHVGFIEHWSETIEWCSRGERKGGDSE